jgi:putative phosphoribosyl transferase
MAAPYTKPIVTFRNDPEDAARNSATVGDVRQLRRPYADRAEAGDALAGELAHYRDRDDVVVLALPRGGVPVAARIATALNAPLDVLLVRKLGVPWHPELAMGAIAGAGETVEIVRNEDVLGRADPSDEAFERVLRQESDELRRRERTYRRGRAGVAINGRVVILVDDGLATGATMRAAATAVRRQDPARLVIAVPIGSPRTCRTLAGLVDELVCPWAPERFVAVGQGYRDFGQVDDATVTRLLG